MNLVVRRCRNCPPPAVVAVSRLEVAPVEGESGCARCRVARPAVLGMLAGGIWLAFAWWMGWLAECARCAGG